MEKQIYEHHITIKQDRICPFLLKSQNDIASSICNWHSNIEVLLVTKGEGRVQYNTDDLFLDVHDIVVVNSGDIHRIYSNKTISIVYIIIDESFCRENGINTEVRCFERVFKCEKTEEIYKRLIQCYNSYKRSPSPMSTASLRHVVLELLIELYSNHSSDVATEATKEKAPQNYVKHALEYIAEHFIEPLTLEDVARVCGITKYHLAREFKKYTGHTVITHINIMRCKKADACLVGGMTVTEAACECGFDSVSYFSRTYKKLMGNLPSSIKRA